MSRKNAALRFLFLLSLGLLSGQESRLSAESWYVSNAAGMALEPAFSRRALRETYALRIRPASETPPALAELASLLAEPFTAQQHSLFKDGELSGERWILQGEDGRTLAAASFNEDASGFWELYGNRGEIIEERSYAKDGSALITRFKYRNKTLLSAETSRLLPASGEADGAAEKSVEESAEGSAEKSVEESAEETPQEAPAQDTGTEDAFYDFSFFETAFYDDYGYGYTEPRAGEENIPGPTPGIEAAPPLPAESSAGLREEPVEEPLWTDRYRYSRNTALRAVERVFHGEDIPVRLDFPSLLKNAARQEVVSPSMAFSSVFLEDILLRPGDTVVYSTDGKGRIIRETRKDSDGRPRGEMIYTWAEDKLASVEWEAAKRSAGEDKTGDTAAEDESGGGEISSNGKEDSAKARDVFIKSLSPEEEPEKRRIEFEYDSAGDRVSERDYRNGILERTVRKEGDTEVEELYKNGRAVLRAIYENGRKVKEEEVRPSGGNNAAL